MVLAASVPVWMRCVTSDDRRPWNRRQRAIARRVMDIILPSDDLGPGAIELGALEFVEWTLSDPFYDQEVQRFIVDGLDELDRRSQTSRSFPFLSLAPAAQRELIEELANEGDRWLSRMVSLVLESVLSDPIYGGNRDGRGWKWLGHYVGRPRPDEQTRYEALLRRRSDR